MTPAPTRREIVWVAAIATVAAVVVHWPLALRLGTHFPDVTIGDPYFQAWQIAWMGHAVLTQPLALFDSNAFFPMNNTLAFSEASIGYLPAGMIGEGPGAALVRYNLLFHFSYALAFVGAYLLARQLGVRHVAALVAGAAYAYAPFRSDQDTHLQVLSSGAIPLALYALWRGTETGRTRAIVAGWLLAAWQVSLSFSLGIPLAYLLVVIGGTLVWARASGRWSPEGRVVRAHALGAVLFAAITAILVLPYLEVLSDNPLARRGPGEVAFFSPPPSGLTVAPAGNLMWGEAGDERRAALGWPPEMSLFPGLATLVLAVAGVIGGPRSRRARVALAGGVAAFTILSLGLSNILSELFYRPLFELAPGWDAMRTPGRLTTFSSLGLALLAAAGAGALWRRLPARAGTVVVAALALWVVVEGTAPADLTRPPEPPGSLSEIADPLLLMPSDEVRDRLYLWWSTDGFPRLVNGLGGFNPPVTGEIRALGNDPSGEGALEGLRSLGLRSLAFYLPFMEDPPSLPPDLPTKSDDELITVQLDQ